MACSTCKKKNSFYEKMNENVSTGVASTSKTVIWFVIIWSLLAVYGFYSLIVELI